MTYTQKIMCSMEMAAKNRLYFAKLTENRQGAKEGPLDWAIAADNA